MLQLHTSKLMGGRLKAEGFLLMLNVGGQSQTGVLADWVVGLGPPELEVKKLIRDIQEGKEFDSNISRL